MVFLAVEAHPDGTNSGRDIVYIRLQGDDGLAITFRDLERSHLGSIKHKDIQNKPQSRLQPWGVVILSSYEGLP